MQENLPEHDRHAAIAPESPYAGSALSRIELPATMRRDKPLSDDDMERVRRQWQLMRDLSSIKIPNEISLRRAAGLPELSQGTLVHGTRFALDTIEGIARDGIVSGELIGIPEDSETHYCADFFRVPAPMSVGEYVAWYDTLEPQENGSRIQVARMERNYLARRARHGERIAVIIGTDNAEVRKLMEKDAYTTGWEDMRTIVTGLPVDRESPKAKRIAAVLCGIPANFISGVILPAKIAENPVSVRSIRGVFGDGVLIFGVDGREIDESTL